MAGTSDQRLTDGLADLYRREYSGLVALAAFCAGGTAEAEDIVQEAFARLAQRWSRVSRYDSPVGWLRLVVVRLAKRALVRQSLLKAVPLRSLRTLAAPADQLDGVGAVLDAMTHLTPRQRAVLGLHIAGLSSEEIGATLKIASSTARVVLRDARDRMTTHLREMTDDAEAG